MSIQIRKDNTMEKFLDHLSQPDGRFLYAYTDDFQIDSRGQGLNSFTVTERYKGPFNPFGWPASIQRRRATALNLAAFFKACVSPKAKEKYLDGLSEKQLVQIRSVLERYKQAQPSRGTGFADIQKAYNDAIGHIDTARKNLYSKTPLPNEKKWETQEFLKKLAKSGIIGRPNFRFHVTSVAKKVPGQNRSQTILTPYTSSKPWFNLGGEVTPGFKKIATVENLEKLIARQMPNITALKLGTKAMVGNIERLVGRMTRNMSKADQVKILNVVSRIKQRLFDAQVRIDNNRAGSHLWMVWWGLKGTALASIRFLKDPIRYSVVLGSLATLSLTGYVDSSYPLAIGSIGACFWILFPSLAKARSTALQCLQGVKTAATLPFVPFKFAYNEIISPTAYMASVIAKLPVRGINWMRQVPSSRTSY